VTEDIIALIEAEIAARPEDDPLVAEFQRLRVKKPKPITVQFSGGIRQTCWIVTRSNGAYCTVYLPSAGYFSLCADSDFGPLDIGVHGPALGVFGSV